MDNGRHIFFALLASAAAAAAACGGSSNGGAGGSSTSTSTASTSSGKGASSTTTTSSTSQGGASSSGGGSPTSSASSGGAGGAGGAPPLQPSATVTLPGNAIQMLADQTNGIIWSVYEDVNTGHTGLVSIDDATQAVGAPLDDVATIINDFAIAPALKEIYACNGVALDVIDTAGKTVKTSVTLPSGTGNFVGNVAFDPMTSKAFVLTQTFSASNSPYVLVFDPSSDTFTTQAALSTVSVAPGTTVGGIAVDGTTSTVFVVAYDTQGNQPHVVELDETTLAVKKDWTITVPAGESLRSRVAATAGQGVTFYTSGMTSGTLWLVDDPITISPPPGADGFQGTSVDVNGDTITVFGTYKSNGGTHAGYVRYDTKGMKWSELYINKDASIVDTWTVLAPPKELHVYVHPTKPMSTGSGAAAQPDVQEYIVKL